MSGAAIRLTSALSFVLACFALAASTRAAAPEQVEPTRERARLVLFTQEGELAFAVERAIATELNDVEIELVRMPLDDALELERRLALAEQAIVEQQALAALWVEPHEDGLMIYVVVAEAGMLGRPVAGEPGEALVEAAAVVVRHFASELLEGGKLGLARTSETSEASEIVTPPHVASETREPSVDAPLDEPREPERWRLAARTRARMQFGYAGHAWAPQQRWVSSVELGLGVRVPLGIHVDLAYALVPRWSTSVRHALDSSPSEVDVRRFPLALQLGYQHAWDRSGLALAGALRFTSEFIERRATSPAIDTRDPLVVVPILEPRAQLDWLFSPPVSLLVGLGLRINLIDYSHGFDSENTANQVVATDFYLEPWTLAPALYLGVGISL